MDNDTVLQPPMNVPAINTVAPGRSVEWIVGGFRIFMKSPGMWLLVGLGMLLGTWIINLLLPSWLSGSVNTVLVIVLMGACMKACAELDAGRDPLGAAQNVLQMQSLWVLGAIGAGLSLVVGIAGVALGVSSIGLMFVSPGMFFGFAGLAFLLILALSFALGMALWLAPALVVLNGVDPVQAVKLSLAASLKNIVPYIVLCVLAMVAMIVGAIPFGLGLLVVFPALICTGYLAYKDLFA
ncbi:MAG: BPSS1780 family membrane protein [Pseudomonadota bacterium]